MTLLPAPEVLTHVAPSRRRLRVGLIGGVRFPQRPPFAGGLEAHTWTLAEGLRDRGHAVTVFGTDAPPGCDVHRVAIDWRPTEGARRDLSAQPADVVAEHHAYLHILRTLARREVEVDVVHNNSTHHLPVAMAPLLRRATTGVPDAKASRATRLEVSGARLGATRQRASAS